MREHNWLLTSLQDIARFAEDDSLPGALAGLKSIIETYAIEACHDEELRNEVLAYLENKIVEAPRPYRGDSSSCVEILN